MTKAATEQTFRDYAIIVHDKMLSERKKERSCVERSKLAMISLLSTTWWEFKQTRSFEDLLDKAIKAYTNKSIETAQVIEQLIELARKMREEQKRNTQLNLTEEEIAFYDALADNESAK